MDSPEGGGHFWGDSVSADRTEAKCPEGQLVPQNIYGRTREQQLALELGSCDVHLVETEGIFGDTLAFAVWQGSGVGPERGSVSLASLSICASLLAAGRLPWDAVSGTLTPGAWHLVSVA